MAERTRAPAATRRRLLEAAFDEFFRRRALPLRLALAAPIAILACAPAPDAPTDMPLQVLRPVLDFRIDADAANLSEIRDVLLSPDGAVVVTQRQDGAVAFLSPDGAAIRFGRTGSGPGEFRSFARPGWSADTLWVADGELRRITLIAPDRSLGRIVPFPNDIVLRGGEPLTGSGTRFWLGQIPGVYPDGTLLVRLNWIGGDAGSTPIQPERPGDPLLVRVTRAGVVVSEVARLPGQAACFVRYGGADFGAASPIPFCRVGWPDDVSDDAALVATISDVVADAGQGSSYRVTVVDAMGDTIYSRAYAYKPIPIPPAVMDSVMRGRRANPVAPEELEILADMRLPATYPPARRIRVGRDTTVWIEPFLAAGDLTFQVLDASGDPSATLSLRRHQTLAVPGMNAILVIEEDSVTGAQSIARYRLQGGR